MRAAPEAVALLLVAGGMMRMVGCGLVLDGRAVELAAVGRTEVDVDEEEEAAVAAAVEALSLFFRLIVSDCSPYGDGALMTINGALFVFCRLLCAVTEAAECDEAAEAD